MVNDIISILRLIRTENVGSITFIKLVEKYGSAQKALNNLDSLMRGKPLKVYSQTDAEKEIELAYKKNIHIITYLDEYYPPLLKQIYDYPPVLFAYGHKHLLKKTSIAVIGARNASLQGKQNAYTFAKQLGEHRYVVTSGLAKGIDSSAHEGALEKGTIACLGGGVDVIYPLENKDLYHRIINAGVLISEFKIGSAPIASNFPVRNRIISGISRGIIVIEASLNSGSIITVKLALEQGREIFAVPGSPGDSRSSGTNMLIKDGATLVENIDDVIQQLKIPMIAKEESVQLSMQLNTNGNIMNEKELERVRKFLLQSLSSSPISVDVLVASGNFEYSYISSAILELELNGKLERFANNKVALINTIK